MNDDEDIFTAPDGTVYDAVPFDDCDDDNDEGHCGSCEFEGDCVNMPCCAGERKDECEVYWVRCTAAVAPEAEPNPL